MIFTDLTNEAIAARRSATVLRQDPATPDFQPEVWLVPADQVCWCVVRGAEAHRLGPACRYRFEAEIPRPLESMHVVQAELPEGDVIVMGVERAVLARWYARHPNAVAFIPDGWPPFVDGASASDAVRRHLNLLSGPFEPPAVRRQRRQRTLIIGAGIVAVVLGVLGGVERRVAHGRQVVALAQAQVDALYHAAFPVADASGLRPEMRLIQELRRAEGALANGGGLPSPIVAVDSLVRSQPAETLIRIQRVEVDGQGMRVEGSAPDAPALQEWNRALQNLPVGTAVLIGQPQTMAPAREGSVAFQATWHWQEIAP